MAYWNPFGWDEETRRGIQSVVRPIMQVASVAASAGAFSGGEAAAGTGAADPGTAPTLPEGVDPGTPGIKETIIGPGGVESETFFGDDVASGSIAMPDGSQLPPSQQYQTSPVMSVPDSTTQLQSLTPQPLETTPFNPQQDAANRAAEAYSKGDMPAYDEALKDLGQGGEHMDLGDRSNWTQADWDRHNLHREQYKNAPDYNEDPLYGKQVGGNQTVKPKPDQTPKQPGEPPATKTPNDKPPKPDGKGPGGNKDKNPFEDGFTWENIQKFLASDEGKKWLLSDKGLMGIGRRLSAAADAGVSGGSRLSSSERKKIKDKLKKYREGIRKKREDDDE